jgi:phosphatidylinositol alpha-1,6-mannosyltransferase
MPSHKSEAVEKNGGGAGRRILMLATDAHGGFGGISQYNRDVLEALGSFDGVGEVVVLPRIVNDTGFDAPTKVRYDLAGISGQWSFLWRSVVHAFMAGRYDLVYCAHINLMPMATAIAAVQRVPLLLAIYGIDGWWRPSRFVVARLANRADFVIAISQTTLDRFCSWSTIDRTATAVLPNAIKAEQFGLGEKNKELVQRLGIERKKIIMTLGRMWSNERAKGFDEVIEIMPRLRELEPDISYIAVGDGDDRMRLEAKARTLGVGDRVHFVGRVPEAQKQDYYRLADAYVMPSLWEGFGFVILEALACGLPVVASIADGTREAVRNGELGVVVDPKDSTALLSAIVEALRRPKQIPAGLAYFSFDNFAGRLHGALGRVIDI